MLTGRLLTSAFSILALLGANTPMALAQDAGPWVDPPAEQGAAPPAPAPQAQPAPAVPPAQSSQPLRLPAVSPTPEAHRTAEPRQASPEAPKPEPRIKEAEPQPQPRPERRPSRADAAKDFAIEYLASWSARNDVALDATAELYAPRVLYHGRTVSLERLYKEKQRFIRRWPEREYRPRPDAIGSECNPAGTVCKVHAVFDYTAASTKRRRISEGSGALQLIIEFIGEKPIIVAENSTLLTQTRKRMLASEGTSHE